MTHSIATRSAGNLPGHAITSNHRVSHLPPAGSSPAADLQRRLSDAALNGFYAKPATPRGRIAASRIALVVACVVLSWAVVFGTGMVLLG